MAESKVNWYENQVLLALDNATDEMLSKLAFQIEGHAKVNITNNGQIQTGFMRNSVYAVTPERSSYGESKAAAEQANPDAEMADEVNVPDGAAAVAVGAEYGIYQEMRKAFLYPAMEQAVADFGGTLRTVKL